MNASASAGSAGRDARPTGSGFGRALRALVDHAENTITYGCGNASAHAGAHLMLDLTKSWWIPAFAGMTE
jgi:hypothetical protein